jgi:hypothetical protein
MRQTRKPEAKHKKQDQAQAQALAPIADLSGRRADCPCQGAHEPLASFGSRRDRTTRRSILGPTDAPQRSDAP